MPVTAVALATFSISGVRSFVNFRPSDMVWCGLASSFSKNAPRGFMLKGLNISGSVPKLRDEKQFRCWWWASVSRRKRTVKP